MDKVSTYSTQTFAIPSDSDKTRDLQAWARVAGVCYLVIIVMGLLGQVFVRGAIVVAGDPAATLANLAMHGGLWRLGIVADLIMHLCDIPVIVFLYWLLSRVNRPLALIALVSNIIQTAVAVANKINLLLPLLLLDTSTPALATVFIDAHNYGFAVALNFFGVSCLIYGYLLARYQLVPTVLAVGLGIAGLCYLLTSLTLLLAPQLGAYVVFCLLVCLVAESAFAIRLLWKGIHVESLARLAG